MTKNMSIKPFCETIRMPILSSTLEQIQYSRERSGYKGTEGQDSQLETRIGVLSTEQSAECVLSVQDNHGEDVES